MAPPIPLKVKIKDFLMAGLQGPKYFVIVFYPSGSSGDHRYFTLGSSHTGPLAVFAYTKPQGLCNRCSIWKTLLPNTHIACSLICFKSLLTNQFLEDFPEHSTENT